MAVHWLQSTAPEILKVKIGEFSVTSFTSITRSAGKGSVKTIDLWYQTAPLTPKPFIYNRRSYSQAGRRGFESLLPLHHFQ